MPETHRQRTIDAPAQEWAELRDAASFLGISAETFTKLVEDRKVPPGVVINRQNVRWHWTTIMATSWLLPFLTQATPEKS